MQQSALRSLAIVCDYMETTLFAIVCDLRFAIRDRLRSSAIIWKPAFTLNVFFVNHDSIVLELLTKIEFIQVQLNCCAESFPNNGVDFSLASDEVPQGYQEQKAIHF